MPTHGLKMAKADNGDIDAAMKVCQALEAISANWSPSMPMALNESDDPDESDPFDIDNHDHCRRVLEHLMDLADGSRLFRVVFGMSVLLDPTNKIVHPDLDYLEKHPDIDAAYADSARFRWLTEDHADPAVRHKCRELLGRLSTMSYSAACQAIDAAMAPAANEVPV